MATIEITFKSGVKQVADLVAPIDAEDNWTTWIAFSDLDESVRQTITLGDIDADELINVNGVDLVAVTALPGLKRVQRIS